MKARDGSLRPVIWTHLSLLLRPVIRTAFSHFFWDQQSGLTSCGWLHWWLALRTSKWSEDCHHQHKARCPNCHQHVLFTCQIVTLLLSFRCFTEPSNPSTRTWGFCMPILGGLCSCLTTGMTVHTGGSWTANAWNGWSNQAFEALQKWHEATHNVLGSLHNVDVLERDQFEKL